LLSGSTYARPLINSAVKALNYYKDEIVHRKKSVVF